MIWSEFLDIPSLLPPPEHRSDRWAKGGKDPRVFVQLVTSTPDSDEVSFLTALVTLG